MHLPGYRPYQLNATDFAGVLVSGCGLLGGWAFQESTDAAGAALVIYDGTGTNGQLIAPITLAQNESTRDYPPCIEFRLGLYVEVTDGDVLGTLWALPGEMVGDYVSIPGLVPLPSGL